MQTEQMETYTQKFGQFQQINSKPFTILDDQWKDTDTVHTSQHKTYKAFIAIRH